MVSTSFRVRIAAVGTLVMVFGAGLVMGLALDRSVAQAAPEEPAATGSEPDSDPEEERNQRRGWIIERVDLSEAQRGEVDAVLEQFRERISRLAEDHQTRYWATVDSTRDVLRAILDEDQRAMYDSLLAESDRRRRNAPD